MFGWLKNKVVQIVLLAVLVVDVALLLYAGFTQEEIKGVIVAVGVIVAAVSSLILIIQKLINKKE